MSVSGVFRKTAFLFLVYFSVKINALECDAVYVVNLKNDSDRPEKIKNQLNKFDIKFQFFKIIDGSDINIVNIETGITEDKRHFHENCRGSVRYSVRGDQVEFKYSAGTRRILDGEELSHILSHLKIIRDIVRNNYKKVIIFEDKIFFEKNFSRDLKKTLKNAPDDTDMLFLDVGVYHNCSSSPHFISPGELLRCFERLYPNNEYIVRLNSENGGVFGSHAYVVTFDGAKKILKNSAVIQWPVKDHIMMIKGVSRYAARKKIVYVNDEKSENGDKQ
ncbi:MAG: glycosyltransferase family 25 protein [Holosporaceae bacterium]|nr:glycosyltransferase family 25 protein [Holosporaceae bacterium]